MTQSLDLFTASGDAQAPLAERLRPRRVEDVVGQRHLLAEGRPLAVALASGKLHSMILWGPPGVGKTTLARLLAQGFGAHFIAISAVLAGVKEIRDAVERARLERTAHGRATILFVDEVHRFNKSQQDAFLPHVESGLLTFIGATTENPSFEVNSALLSRAQVYVLESLGAQDLDRLVVRGFEAEGVDVTEEARKRIVEFADGDGRRALNLAEQVANAARAAARHGADAEFVDAVVTRSGRRFDKGGENFYDQISALHKSVRGSDPDASLYWMVRMLDGGADPRYLARRMVRMASEDVGLADPRALELAIRAAEVYERLGSPEGELALAECVIYLAVAPKSNAVYRAYGAAREFISKDSSRPVPMHLRNAPTRLMKDLGYGKDYRYAHDEEGGYAAGETYLPDGMDPPGWYEPTDRGLEAKIREKLAWLRKRDEEGGAGGGGR
jgi:putative ATPase